MTSKVAVHVKLTAPEGKGADLIAAFEELYTGPLDAEGGTELHIIHAAKDNPDVVFFYELYADEESYKAHGAGEALKAVMPKLAGLVAAAPEMLVGEPRNAKGISV